MSDKTYVTIKAEKHDIRAMMRKYLGNSSNGISVDWCVWSDGSKGWIVEFGEEMEYEVYQLKAIFGRCSVVGSKAIYIGVK